MNFNIEVSNTKSILKNNNCEFVGYLVDLPKFNHENLGKKYYKFYIRVPFKNKSNILPVIASEDLLKNIKFVKDNIYLVRGRWASAKGNKEVVNFLYVKKVMEVDKNNALLKNYIEMDGYLLSNPKVEKSFNVYKNIEMEQVVCTVKVFRPSEKKGNTILKVKSDNMFVAFRGDFIQDSLKLKQRNRIKIKGYIEEEKDKNNNLLRYVVVPYEVTLVEEKLK